jgi:hypothetical protein
MGAATPLLRASARAGYLISCVGGIMYAVSLSENQEPKHVEADISTDPFHTAKHFKE